MYYNKLFFFSLCKLNHPQEQRRPLCRFDLLDLGQLEENIRRAQACKKIRHLIVDPDLANLVAQHLQPENSKSVILECNAGMSLFYTLIWIPFIQIILCQSVNQ